MTSILTDWGKRCIEKLIKRGRAEARFVFCLSCIANEFDEERARLKPEWETLEKRVKVAKRRNNEIPPNVVSWEEKVDKLLKEDIKEKQTCAFGFCPDCIWRYKRGKKLANDTKEVKRLTEKVETFVNIELPRPPPGVERNSSQDYISFESRESEYKSLLDALKDDNNYITGLQGMGGTGKTTLAIKVGKELKESGQFTCVIDTTVSATPDIKKIQDDIAGPLGLHLDGCNESDRFKTLLDRLTNGEKILLILDDVWEGDPLLVFNAIGIPQRGNHEGCRVLVTTRSKQLSNIMNFDKSIELKLLSEEDAWIMFKRYANIRESSSKKVKKKGREIAKECKKLPVVIAVTASSLKGHHDRMEKWNATLTSLKRPITLDGVHPDLVGVFNCLKVSYDNMNDEKARGLFRLCSVFPEDEEMSVELLTRLSIGAGLFGEDYGSYNDARNQVVVAINTLLDYCLLLEVEEKIVKMHDLIRDVARWIARKESQGVNLSNKDQKSLIEKETNIKCLLFEGSYKDLFFCKFDGSKLETLIAYEDRDCNVDRDEDCNMKIPNSFFENIVNLRVLCLSGDGNRSLSLTNSFQSLKNIRSMAVCTVDLGDISVLRNLQRLEALDLVNCEIHELPIEIGKLENLKLLRLESCKIGKGNPFEAIKICLSLEELYFIESFNDFCRDITLPTKLQRYHIGTKTWRNTIYFSVSKRVVLCEKVYGYFTKGTIKYFMQTAEAIKLSRINSGWRNIMAERVPIEKGMNDLVELHLEDDPELKLLIDTKHIDSQAPNDVFSKLVVLKLEQMERLEELCNGSISLDSLNNLKKLTIKRCEKLRSLFRCSTNICNLKKLKIASCSTLISVFDLTSSQSLLKLETLEIKDCGQLKSIFTYERRGDDKMEEIVDGDNNNSKSCNSMFPNMKFLCIEGCPQLQFILPRHSAGDLSSLKFLMLHDVPNFIDIFSESDHSMPPSIKRSSNSISKTQTQLEPIKSNLFSWSHICCHRYKLRGPTGTDISLVSEGQQRDFSISTDHLWERAQCLSRLSHLMCNIKVMILVKVSKIKSIFVLSITSRMMLESLTIENCDELKHIIVDMGDSSCGSENSVFPKLKELEVKNCGKLEYIFGLIDDGHDHQNHNLHLQALKFLKLSSLRLTGMCTKNYRITFPPLAEFELGDCTQDDIKSIGDFIVKELSWNMEHFVALERLKLDNSKVESICRLNEAGERQMNLGWQNIELHNLRMMTYLFVGLKNSFDLENLARLKIMGCEKLEIVFSTSIIMFLPQLLHIRVEECKELKHMIEHDLENRKTVCFPKLRTLFVQKCNMLKDVFPISICKELPELEALMIREADNLEEIFVCEGDQKVNMPNIKLVEFVNLPSLCQTQRIHFQAVPHCFVQNCQEIYLNTASPKGINICDLLYKDFADFCFYKDMQTLFVELQKKISDRNTWNENPSSKTIKATAAAGIEVQVASGHMLTSSQLEGSTSEKPVAEPLSTISGTENEPPVQVIDHKQKGIEITVEKGTSKRIRTSQDQNIQEGSTSGTKKDQVIQLVTLKQKSIKSSFEDDDLRDSQDTNLTNNNQVPLNDYSLMKVSSNIEEQFPKDGEIISNSKPSPIASQFPTIPSQDFDLYLYMESLYRQFQEVSKGHSNGNENPSAQTNKEFSAWIEAKAASRHELTSSQLEGSASEKLAGATLSTVTETINELPIQLVAPKQKGNEIGFEEGTTSTCDKTITSATHLGVGDGIICIPSSSNVNIKFPATKYVDILNSQETAEMEDINKLIEEDPLLALEKLLTGVQSYSIESLLQELKTLMESVLDLDHLVSNRESKEKLMSLFDGFNQHQGLLPSDVKEYVQKVQNFFNDNISNHATSQEVLKKHNQLLDSKTNLMNKLLSAQSTQTHIDNETSNVNAQIHELSLQIDELRKKLADIQKQRDDLKLVVNKCDVQKNKLKVECTEWAQQSKELLSELASSEVNAREVERARNLAKEGFSNLKSSFPIFYGIPKI